MPINPSQVRAFVSERSSAPLDTPAAIVPRPEPADVLYTPPNPDGSRKACLNCALYAAAARECFIHAENLKIAPTKVCGYHVFAPQPVQTFPKRLPILPVTPDLSGLESMPGGASCDLCVWYVPVGMDDGECLAVATSGMPELNAAVQPKGCCARMRPR